MRVLLFSIFNIVTGIDEGKRLVTGTDEDVTAFTTATLMGLK
jgi:hypothetical protein